MPELASAIVVGLEGSENFRKATEGFGKVRGAMRQMNTATGGMTRIWGGFTRVLGTATRALGTAWRAITRIGMIGVGAFAGIIGGLTLIGRQAVRAQSSLEDIQTMLSTAFGETAAKAFAAAERYSIKTPFTPEAVARGAIFLKQLKVVPNAGKDLLKWMRLAGDMAGSMKRDFLEAVFAIGFGLSGESDRLKQFGITVRDLIEAGALGKLGQGINIRTVEGGRRFLEAMEKIISTRFAGGAASLAKTLSGLWSTFRGLAQFMWADVTKATERGTSMFDRLKEAVASVNKMLEGLRDSPAWIRLTQAVSGTFGMVIEKAREALERKLPGWIDKVATAAQNLKGWLDTNWGTMMTAMANAGDTAWGAVKKLAQWTEKLTGMDMTNWASNSELAFVRVELAMLNLVRAGMKWATLAGILGILVPGVRGKAGAVAGAGLIGGIKINQQINEAVARIETLKAEGLKVPGAKLAASPAAQKLEAPSIFSKFALMRPDVRARFERALANTPELAGAGGGGGALPAGMSRSPYQGNALIINLSVNGNGDRHTANIAAEEVRRALNQHFMGKWRAVAAPG